MGLFRRAKPMDPAEIDRMKAEMASLREALERHGSVGDEPSSPASGPSTPGRSRPIRATGSTSWPPRWPSSTPG